MAVVAGTSRFTLWKFVAADGLAAIVSGGLFVYLGYVFSHNFELIKSYVEKGKEWALLAVAVVLAALVVWYFVRRRRRSPTRSPVATGIPLDDVADSGTPAK